jgi:hypothetical protein
MPSSFRTAALGASIITLPLCLLFALPAAADVGLTINGSAVNVSPPPITQAGRVFVPLRGVFERLGASVVYADGQINATGNGRSISLHIGSTQATVDGQPQTIDVAPFIIGASTYVPLRFLSESLGANVDWDDADSLVAITLASAPQQQQQQDDPMTDGPEYADQAPPPIPAYDQPPVPDPNEIWQPGFWAWGANGYYWVPGTWVAPPQTGYLWTPGYWQADNNRFAWNPGYWAIAVGFYGGVNYGAGYYGNGYVGGRWSNNQFHYNTYVTHVNTTVIRNVYVDRSVTVVVNDTSPRVGYNGGPHGVQARPTTQQLAVAHVRHIEMTPVQQQHVETAAHDPRLFATVNHNQPPVLAVARPLKQPAYAAPPAPPATHVAPPVHEAAPADHRAPAAPAYHAAPAAPAYRPAPAAPVDHAAPAAPAYHPAPAAPAYHPAPAAPEYRRAPAAPVDHAAPAAPAYHPAPAAPEYRRAPAAPIDHAAPAAPAYHPAPAAPAYHAAPAATHVHEGAAPEHERAPRAEPTR